MKKLYVVRHAEAEHNISDLANDSSSTEVALTAKGLKQAELLAVELKAIPFDAVFTSQQERTIETARILNVPHNAPVFSDERLNDIRTGMQNNPFDEFRQALAKSRDKWNAHFNDGESFEDEKRRTIDFLNSLKDSPYDNLLIVTHGGVANIMYGLAHRLDNEQTFNRAIDNASVFSCELAGLL